jgi:signal transduction histidine kinase
MTDERAADSKANEELRAFMATLAHDLRTPLAAVYGEVDLALRRDRTADTYREILNRIRVGLSELLDLSADLALLGETQPGPPGGVSLREVVAALALRYPDMSSEAPGLNRLVAGDQARLVRALGLVIEHLRKCDPSGDPVMLEDATLDRGVAPVTRLVLRTGPSGAVRRGTFRLRAAAQIVGAFGGALDVVETQPGTAVEIRLPRVLPNVE